MQWHQPPIQPTTSAAAELRLPARDIDSSSEPGRFYFVTFWPPETRPQQDPPLSGIASRLEPSLKTGAAGKKRRERRAADHHSQLSSLMSSAYRWGHSRCQQALPAWSTANQQQQRAQQQQRLSQAGHRACSGSSSSHSHNSSSSDHR